MALEKKVKFGRIGILMGGPSSEREISLKSGKAVYEVLKNADFEVVAVDITSEDKEENIKLIKSYKLDCAFLALHGRFGEDGQIQEILESIALCYTGSGVLASKLAMDKIASRRIFELHGLSVPRYKILHQSADNPDWKMHGDFSLPLVIKPVTHGSSIGLSIVDRKQDLDRAIREAFKFDERVMLEEYIEGREVTVGILGEEALPIIEIIPKKRFFDYQAKYQPGMTDYIAPAQLKEEVRERVQGAAILAHRFLGCYGCSRVDIILNKENIPYILELNTIPGLTATSLLPKAAKLSGIEFLELCIKLIQFAYAKTKAELSN